MLNVKPLLLLIILSFSLTSFAQSRNKSSVAESEINATLKDIRSTLGMVPTMFKEYPPEALPGAWEEFKNIQLNANSAIAPKYKELVGLAVSSQIPCDYCVYAHKQLAKMHGASDKEIKEAIAVAAVTRKWSTYLYGNQISMDNFKKDVGQMVANAKTSQNIKDLTPAPVPMAAAELTTSENALKDIQNMFGFTPEFLREYHKPALVGAWKEMRDFQMNAATQLPIKMKDLISLGVSAQIPCQYCVHADTEFAKLDGASADEIKEAVAMAGVTRTWSTVLNGLDIDEAKFRREIDQLVSMGKKRMGTLKTPRQASRTVR